MKPYLKHLALLLAILVSVGVAFAADENLKAATDAAEQWLALVDSGQYANSWDEASSFFKEKITKEDWIKALNNVRSPLGNMESRQFKGAEYRTQVPKAPPGKYFIIQYQTKFSGGGRIIETITPMLDKDGKWRVSGYYVKPDTE